MVHGLGNVLVGVTILKPCSQGQRWPLEELTVPFRRQFGGPFLCLVVDMVEPESLCVPRIPLKVVEQRPHEVSTYICAFPSESETIDGPEAYVI